jgi:hypothetical protein
MLAKRLSTIVLTCALALSAEEKVDLFTVNRIKNEAFTDSKVMNTMFYLTDVYGPRLTNSPNFKAAGAWAVKRLQEFGIKDAHQEKWGPFGRGWVNRFYEAHMVEPQYSPISGVALAWTNGTPGSIIGEPVLAVIRSEEDMQKFHGLLKGKIILSTPPRTLPFPTTPTARRYTDAELAAEATEPEPGESPGNFAARMAANGQPPMSREERMQLQNKIARFMMDEGVAVVVSAASQGDGDTIFAAAGGTYDPSKAPGIPAVSMMPEQYNRIARLVKNNVPVKLEFNIKNEFTDEDESFNIVGEIPGTGPHKDEVVMLGGHFDSWQGGTGATDNGAGSAVMMEAIRILKATDLQLDRTVRIALWGGEEEGLLGSRAYVKEHFADRETMKLTEQHAKISGYFNLDNGTGKIRGVYLQGNDMMRPIFESWLAPFKDLGVSTISPRNTGGTDHLSFDGVGIPGFQFIQDPMDYETRTHHSNMDVYDRIQAGDLMQASAVIASLVYDTANRPELLPRKPLPAPQPARRPMPTVTVLPTAAVTTPAAAKKAKRRMPAPAATPTVTATAATSGSTPN